MRYFFGFFITIGLLILLIIMLIRSGPNSNSSAPKDTRTLSSYALTDSNVIMTNSGPVNANSLHRQIRIKVDSSYVTYEELAGYNGKIIRKLKFANTKAAYDVFLRALGHAGYMLGDSNKELANELGYCPQNHRYVYELNNDGDQLQRYWSSDCGSPKTYLGNASLTIDLFQAQVPDYNKLSQELDF